MGRIKLHAISSRMDETGQWKALYNIEKNNGTEAPPKNRQIHCNSQLIRRNY